MHSTFSKFSLKELNYKSFLIQSLSGYSIPLWFLYFFTNFTEKWSYPWGKRKLFCVSTQQVTRWVVSSNRKLVKLCQFTPPTCRMSNARLY